MATYQDESSLGLLADLTAKLWHKTMNQLLEDVESVAFDYLHERLAGCSTADRERKIYDISMSYISNLERIGLIVLNSQTGKLVQGLPAEEYRLLADNFVSW